MPAPRPDQAPKRPVSIRKIIEKIRQRARATPAPLRGHSEIERERTPSAGLPRSDCCLSSPDDVCEPDESRHKIDVRAASAAQSCPQPAPMQAGPALASIRSRIAVSARLDCVWLCRSPLSRCDMMAFSLSRSRLANITSCAYSSFCQPSASRQGFHLRTPSPAFTTAATCRRCENVCRSLAKSPHGLWTFNLSLPETIQRA